MLKIFNLRLLPVMCFLLAIGIGTSCKKNDAANSGEVKLLSFGPTGARPGDTLKFVGLNLNKVTTIELSGGASVAQAGFLSQSSELILIIVPQETQRGYIMLKTPDGDIRSKTILNLMVPLSVTSITPQARPGENITINGQYLNWVTQVKFNNDKIADSTSIVSKSLTQLVIKVPVDAQSGPLVIYYGGTEPGFVETADTLIVKLPVATALAPNPVKHASNLTITGTDLDLAKKVFFTGVSMPITTFVSQSATQLVITIPAGTQKGKVTLEAASGVQTISAMDVDVLLPAVTAMSPNPVDPGTNLTIDGTNFDLVTSVTFQNAPAVTTFISQTATKIVVKVPAGILRGKITLGVLNSTLTVLSPDILEVIGAVPPPTVAFPFYNDAVTSNWNGWIGGGWGGTSDRANTSPVRDGTKSIKIDYVGGYGSPLQLGGATVNLSSYTSFKISIYGGVGTTGKKINIGINGGDSYTINLVEGKWTDYSIPISTLTSATVLKEIWVKEYSGTGGFTIYVDALGLN